VSVLKLFCAHCDHPCEDPLEVLNADSIEEMRCEPCGGQFWFAVMECHACAHDQAFTWLHPPSAAALWMLACEACGNIFRRGDASDRIALS
jgi:hypothetical protein